MSSKSWTLSASGVALALLMILGGFNSYVDKGGFARELRYPVRDRGRGIAPRIKLNGALQSDASILFLGTSRTQYLDVPSAIEGAVVYNAAFFAATMVEIEFTAHQVLATERIRRIFLEVSFFAFANKEQARGENRLARVSWAERMGLYLSWRSLKSSAEILGLVPPHISGAFLNVDTRSGRIADYHIPTAAREDRYWRPVYEKYTRDYIEFGRERLTALGLASLDRLLADARAHDVEVVLYIPPLGGTFRQFMREVRLWDDLLAWKKAIARRGPVLDMLRDWPPEVEAYFADPAHLHPAHSDFLLGPLWEAEAIGSASEGGDGGEF